MDWIRDQVNVLCKRVRQDAVALTDSFALTDYIINSPLGRYNGDVYESYFKMVQSAHPPAQVPAYFEREISPMLNFVETEDDVLELDDDDE